MTTEGEILLGLLTAEGADAVVELANAEAWEFVQRIHALEDRFHEEIWRTDEGCLVRLIHDHFVEVGYVAIEGPGRERVAERVRAVASTVTLDEALAMTKDDLYEDRIVGAMRVAALAPTTFEPRIHACFVRLAGDDEPDVRLEILVAISRVGWIQFLPVAERLIDDPDPRVARDAKLLAELLRDAQG